tara:strand:- start:306 stop:683 length:378 start_codon:yes stop_codon:yes gene_type:complete
MSSKVLLSGKIHRARVTQADLDYVGSVSIDEGLMEAAGIVEWEKVAILDVTNGERLETYAIKAPWGSREICINGAAAHLVKPGDLVIILSFLHVDADSVHEHKPKIVIVNENNEIVSVTEGEGNP